MSSNIFSNAVITSLLFLTLADSHMVIRTPQPYLVPKPPTTSPLGAGVPFPCQMGTTMDYSSSSPSIAEAGGNITVSFIGQAVHGGGSAQVSLYALGNGSTVTADPNDWKVVHSIIGGTPAIATGNLDETSALTATLGGATYPDGPQCTSDDEENCLRTFNIPLSENIPAGNYVFSHTWFNKIGNREMYQNCAFLQINSKSTNKDYLSSLPGMFVANYPGFCTTTETNGVLEFPNPGASVEKCSNPLEQGDPAVLGSCSTASGVYQAAPSTPLVTSTFATTTIVESTITNNVIGNSATSDLFTAAVVSTTTQIAAPAVFSSAIVLASSNSVTCTGEGSLVCLDSEHFGLCNFGQAIPQAVALGTQCIAGAIVKRNNKPSTLEQKSRGYGTTLAKSLITIVNANISLGAYPTISGAANWTTANPDLYSTSVKSSAESAATILTSESNPTTFPCFLSESRTAITITPIVTPMSPNEAPTPSLAISFRPGSSLRQFFTLTSSYPRPISSTMLSSLNSSPTLGPSLTIPYPVKGSNSTHVFTKPATAITPSSNLVVPCLVDGQVVCIGISYFGICDHGFAVAQQLAAGTKCRNGMITKRSYIGRFILG
jgi:hypothetical protein